MQQDNRDKKYVNEKKISKYLKCTLCLQVFFNPQRLKCGHTFCKECILNWLNIKAQCPLCKLDIKQKKLETDLVAAGLISELSVYCCNRDYGCKWNGEQDRLESHENKCTVREVAEKLKLKKSEARNNESDEDVNANDPGNLWFRVTAKLEDQEKKEQVLNTLGQQKQIISTLDDNDPLTFLDSLDQYLGDSRRDIELFGIDLPKQQRDRVSQSQQ